MSDATAMLYRNVPGTVSHSTRVIPGSMIAVIVVASLLILLISGNPVGALTPVLVVCSLYGARSMRLQYSVYLLLVLVIAADIGPHPISGADASDTWASPLYPLQGLLLDNLDKTVGISALHFSGTEVVLAGMLVIVLLHTIAGSDIHARTRGVVARPMVAALAFELTAIVVLELRGMARGGDMRQSLWQFRQLVWLPAVVFLLARSVRSIRDLIVIAWVVTFTACLKAAIGLYYYFLIAKPHGFKPHSVTSHPDTALFVGTIVIWVAAAVARPSRRRIVWALAIFAFMLMVIVANNRRTAYVSIVAGLAPLIVLLPRPRKRVFMQYARYVAPFVVAYLVIGRNQTTGFFAPAGNLFSVSNQDDDSSLMRDIENYNLIVTVKPYLLMGTGWGHEYTMAVQAHDISSVFEQFRYIPHNSVLWLVSIGGFIGFVALWLPIPIGVFLAARSYRQTSAADEQAAAGAAIGMYIIFMIQAWSDMGAGSWTTILLLGCAIVTSGKLATFTGAWPARTYLFGRQRPRIPAGSWSRRARLGAEVADDARA